MRHVVTIGTFDLLHRGHLNLFRLCRALAGPEGRVSVGVNTDDFVAKFKGIRPFQDEATRWNLIGALKMIDMAYYHEGDTDDFLHCRRGDFNNTSLLVVGSDWASRDYYAQIGITRDRLRILGYTLIYVDYTDGLSSTEIRGRITE